MLRQVNTHSPAFSSMTLASEATVNVTSAAPGATGSMNLISTRYRPGEFGLRNDLRTSSLFPLPS
jgi:hypothetical protein